MKKILSILLAVSVLLLLTACNTADHSNIPDATDGSSLLTSENETTADTSAGAEYGEDDYKIYRFTATVLSVDRSYLTVETDDENMLRCADRFAFTLPGGVSGEDYAVGDVIEIDFCYPILEVYPARIQHVIAVRHVVRKTTTLDITVQVTAIDGDTYTVMGLTEGYEREFLVIEENENWEIGDILSVSYRYRGGYSEEHPKVLKGVIGNTEPMPILMKARILNIEGDRFTVHDFDKVNPFDGMFTFPEAAVDPADYQAGDYVEITHDRAIPDITHPTLSGLSMRHLTEEEIEALAIPKREHTVTLQYMGQDERYATCLSGNDACRIPVEAIKDLPALQFGDCIEVVYDGTIDYASFGSEIIPFIVSVSLLEKK